MKGMKSPQFSVYLVFEGRVIGKTLDQLVSNTVKQFTRLPLLGESTFAPIGRKIDQGRRNIAYFTHNSMWRFVGIFLAQNGS